jgi:transcriptional regulator with XRE-family HTH domain
MQEDIEYIRRKLRDMNMKAVARESGVPYATIRNVKIGKSNRVMYDTMKKLSDYFRGVE